MGSASAGIVVARMFLRNRKMTMTTMHSDRRSVNFTSATEALIELERS